MLLATSLRLHVFQTPFSYKTIWIQETWVFSHSLIHVQDSFIFPEDVQKYGSTRILAQDEWISDEVSCLLDWLVIDALRKRVKNIPLLGSVGPQEWDYCFETTILPAATSSLYWNVLTNEQ